MLKMTKIEFVVVDREDWFKREVKRRRFEIIVYLNNNLLGSVVATITKRVRELLDAKDEWNSVIHCERERTSYFHLYTPTPEQQQRVVALVKEVIQSFKP